MKRVNFKRIAVKNFLSIGEEPVVINLTEGLHVITGNNKDKPERRNAIGKSTIADAIYFAIFGDTLREIKKDLIINNITGGGSHVELDFDVITPSTTNEYKVIRTLSPTKVYIYENNIDITHDTTANTTKYICELINASPSIFKNCVIMTVNNAVPFMAKNKVEKRKFIEDIFGLEVFSEMSQKLRVEYNEIKREYDTKNTVYQEIEKALLNYNNQKDLILNKRKEKKELYITRQQNNIIELKQIQKEISDINIPDINDIKNKINTCETGLDKCDIKINEITSLIATFKQQAATLQETYDSIGTNKDKCPVCLRSIEAHNVQDIKAEKDRLEQTINNINSEMNGQASLLTNIHSIKNSIKVRIKELRTKASSIALIVQDKNNKESRATQIENWLLELQEDLKTIDSENTDFDEIINETALRLQTVTSEVEELKKTLTTLDVVKYIISEEGVKSYIVNKLLELLNGRLLYYLQKLDSNSICVFNEYFEEEILNEKNKVCSYFNFSGAERKAIDLACLFTFSDLRRMQGGVHYNLSIYDELFDSSFDDKGIELITTILQNRVEELHECTLIISHRKESIKAVTGDVIFLEKENGITRRVEYTDY
jgi:DNA repair exonuclease SbcCD ATPase subunit